MLYYWAMSVCSCYSDCRPCLYCSSSGTCTNYTVKLVIYRGVDVWMQQQQQQQQIEAAVLGRLWYQHRESVAVCWGWSWCCDIPQIDPCVLWHIRGFSFHGKICVSCHPPVSLTSNDSWEINKVAHKLNDNDQKVETISPSVTSSLSKHSINQQHLC